MSFHNRGHVVVEAELYAALMYHLTIARLAREIVAQPQHGHHILLQAEEATQQIFQHLVVQHWPGLVVMPLFCDFYRQQYLCSSTLSKFELVLNLFSNLLLFFYLLSLLSVLQTILILERFFCLFQYNFFMIIFTYLDLLCTESSARELLIYLLLLRTESPNIFANFPRSFWIDSEF